MQEKWKRWVVENLLRGVQPLQIYRTLLGEGFAHRQAIAVLGQNLSTQQLGQLRRENARRHPVPAFLSSSKLPGLCSVNSQHAQLFRAEGFLPLQECQAITRLVKQHLRPSTITTSDTETDQSFRTSSTCDLARLDSALASRVSDRIVGLFGFPGGNDEPIQAQHYAVGQQFKAHTDYFEPGTQEYHQFAKAAGQRTWTCMVYLNDVEAGGQTEFTELDVSFKPRAGMAVIWNNLGPDGAPNPFTRHQAHPVQCGEKVVITKWFRQNLPAG